MVVKAEVESEQREANNVCVSRTSLLFAESIMQKVPSLKWK